MQTYAQLIDLKAPSPLFGYGMANSRGVKMGPKELALHVLSRNSAPKILLQIQVQCEHLMFGKAEGMLCFQLSAICIFFGGLQALPS